MNATLVSVLILCATVVYLVRRVSSLEKLCASPKLLKDIESKQAWIQKAHADIESRLGRAIDLKIPAAYADLPWIQVEDRDGKMWCQYKKQYVSSFDANRDFNEAMRILQRAHVPINEEFTGVFSSGSNEVVKITWAKWPELEGAKKGKVNA